MKTETKKLADKLGEKLRRGNGGSYESDITAIRSVASDYIEREAWTGDTIAEIATRFAVWVLYAFHNATPPAPRCPVCKSRDCIGAKFPIVVGWDSASPDSVDATVFAVRNLAGEFERVDLTKLNNRKSISDPNNDVDAGPIDEKTAIQVERDSLWNDAIAEAFPLLSDLGRFEVSDAFEAVGLLRLMMNGDDLGNAGTDAFDNWVASVRKTVLKRRLSPEEFTAEFGGDDGGFCPENSIQDEIIKRMNKSLAAADYPFPEASNAAKGVADGELLGTHTIKPAAELEREKLEADRVARGLTPGGGSYFGGPGDGLRRCDNCKRWFSGPAELDAKFTFCGKQCQANFSDPERIGSPAVVARPPIADPDETKAINDARIAAAIDEPANVKCDNCDRIVPSPDTFAVCGPRSAQPRTLCSVRCVETFLIPYGGK